MSGARKLPVLRIAEVLAALPLPLQGWVESIARAAGRRGVVVYLVGGPVRDLLLERPVRDVDLLVDAVDAAKMEKVLRRVAGDAAQLVKHERFGTLTLRGDDFAIDVAGTRREIYVHPGALPRVEPASLEEDLERRDFTVNTFVLPLSGPGLAEGDDRRPLPLRAAEHAEADLIAGSLRVLHARSFHDDPTRALRAARLAMRLDFTLARSARSSLRDALRDGAFGAVSGDRLRREFEKLFGEAVIGLDPALALRQLADWHVLSALEPGLDLPRTVAGPVRSLGRTLQAPPWPLARHRPWVAGLALWLAPLSPGLRKRVLARLSVRGEPARRISAFAKLRDGLLRQLGKARGRGAVDALLGEIDEESLLALHASAPQTVRRRIVRWAAEDRQRRPSFSGADLSALGLEGPAVGRVLARIRAAYLDGAVANREESLALATELATRSKAASESRRGRGRKKAARSRSASKRGDAPPTSEG